MSTTALLTFGFLFAAGSYDCLVRNRKKDAICVNAAVCSSKQTVHFIDNSMQYATNGIYEFMPKEIVDMFHLGKLNLDKLPEVACLPMMDILDRYICSVTIMVGGWGQGF